MQKRRWGSTDYSVVEIGQGTWYDEHADVTAAAAAIRLGLDQGLTHIDTAEMYASGAAEAAVGAAIEGRRDKVFLVSKVLPENASRRGTLQACKSSLKRLGTHWLDCYLLHWRGSHPLAETFSAFEQLQAEGEIRCWGVSNFDVADLDEAWEIAATQLTCNQVLYHLQERAIEHAVIPWCEQHGVAVVAYSPFGHGKFPGPHSSGGRVLQMIADAHQATPRQVALRFLLRHSVLFAIPKTGRPEHVAENAAAGDLQLSAEELARIDAAFPRGRRPRELPTL